MPTWVEGKRKVKGLAQEPSSDNLAVIRCELAFFGLPAQLLSPSL